MDAIEISGLTKSYKDFKLDNVSLTLPGGCIMGLIGENGAGKSTLINLILGISRAESGSVKLLGRNAMNDNDLKLAKEDIGVVLDNVGLPLSFKAKHINDVMDTIYKNWDEQEFYGYLKRFDLPENKAFGKLSNGMKMKMGIAIALSHKAKLLILDEATNGLDPVIRDEITDVFNEFTRDESHSILISSHIVSDLEKICDYVAFLHKGKLMLCEEKDILLEQYGILQCSEQQLEELDHKSVIGKKLGRYGAQALIKRSAVPKGLTVSPVTIEELFVYMIKEEQ